jgi:hypothetical protein
LNNYFKNILAILIGISISFVLLEGLLRIFEPIEYRVKGNKIKLPRDKKFFTPNDKTDKLDKIILYTRNHLGFRGEMPPRNFEDTLTIIAIGGSTTECRMISDGKTWCDILTVELKRHFKPFWLNNAGLDGASSRGHITLMEDYIVKLKPKVILFLVGANEIGQAGYPISDAKHLQELPDTWMDSLMNKLFNHSEVLSYALNLQRYDKARRGGLAHEIINFGKLPPADIPESRASAWLEQNTRDFLKPYAQRLTKLIELCRENAIEPVFITQPMVFGDVIDPATGVDLGRASTYNLNGSIRWRACEIYNDILRDTALRHHTGLIDLARQMPKNSEYYYDSHHFSNAGCQRVAKIIAAHLEPFLAERCPQYLLNNPSATP